MSPIDRSLSRAERRRLEKGQREEGVTGKVGCRFCRSTRGTYVKSTNAFECWTPGCKGNPNTPPSLPSLEGGADV